MFDITRKFKVGIPGGPTLTLTPSDHVTSGGEGHIYHVIDNKGNDLAIKIFDDPNYGIKKKITEKVRALSNLNSSYIVTPKAVVLGDRGIAIGVATSWVKDGWALPLAFTNDWRQTRGFNNSQAIDLASKMRDVVALAHKKSIVIGDGNELNILGVLNSDVEPRYIDVDSWIPKGFAGDKILPTIKDYHSPDFSMEADWFAWAVVTFQLFVGVHPYRGTHPDFKRNALEGRMRANASVFSVNIRLSPAARSFSIIPGDLLDWYYAVFQDKLRAPPPKFSPKLTAKLKKPTVDFIGARIAGGSLGGLRLDEVCSVSAPVLRVVAPDVILLQNGQLLCLPDGKAIGRPLAIGQKASIVCSKLSNGKLICAVVEHGRVKSTVIDATASQSPLKDTNIAATRMWIAENRIFAVVNDGLLELQTRELMGQSSLLPARKWPVGIKATAFGDEILMYDALGAKFAVVPFGDSMLSILRMRELDNMKPIAMLRNDRISIMTLIDRSGSYHKAIVVFNPSFSTYNISLSEVDAGGLSDVISYTGVIVHVNTSGNLDLTSPITGHHKEARSPDLRSKIIDMTDVRLLSVPSGIFMAKGDKVHKLSLT